MESQYCPICNAQVEVSPRYPEYVCHNCESEAKSADGRKLAFGFDGGGRFIARYLDGSGEEAGGAADEHICYINGIKCLAREAHMGGIIIIPVK